MRDVVFWPYSARDGESILRTWAKQQRQFKPSIHGTVCVVEGDPGIRKSLSMLLGTLGVSVVAFSTAEEFLDQVNRIRPDFLITELDLPRLGGFEIMRALGERGIHVPAIGLTYEVNQDNRQEASGLGFLELIEKPFVNWAVVERVEQTLGDLD